MKIVLILLIFFVHYQNGLGFMDLFLDRNEVNRLLGVPFEIHYIKAGRINERAVDHNFSIPPSRNTSTFCWKSISQEVHYSVDVVISDRKSLSDVNLSVNLQGYVPSNVETVSIDFVCSGLNEAVVLVEFHFVFTLEKFPDNETKIAFRRQKTCKKDHAKWPVEAEPVIVENTDSSQLKVFYIVLCLGCSLFTILIICISAYVLSNKKDNRQDSLQTEQQIRLNPTETENVPFIMSPSAINSGTSTSSNISQNSMKKKPRQLEPAEVKEKIKALTIPKKRVRIQQIEMEGTFGRVFIGTYTKEDGTEDEVIVKTVMDFANMIQISALVREGINMYALKHKNIMTVLGVCLEDNQLPYVLYLREGFSNLKKYLLKCKHCQDGMTRVLTTQEVVDIAMQITCGIQHMHKKKFLHKDMATRNCLIDDRLNVKIADNALSRDLFPNDYHCLGDNENRPVKWLAIESLVNRTFSTASDVWSFGVTLWELTTLAAQPYSEVDPFEVEHYLRDGYRLSQPVNCPDELFAVMAYCWAMSPSERPTFPQLLTCLQDFRTQLNKYV